MNAKHRTIEVDPTRDRIDTNLGRAGISIVETYGRHPVLTESQQWDIDTAIERLANDLLLA